MKKNVLALSIATMIGGLGFAGAASAEVLRFAESTATNLQLAESGIGNALVVPYFTAQNGNMTVLHVTNTDTENGKAVKVRFRGASNSDDILDFQLYLSPGDVWTGAVTAGKDGVAQLTTADNSCTVPKLTAGKAQSFITGRLDPKLTGDDLANETREGYVEIFNMADIPKGSSLYTAIKHVSGVAPCTSSVLNTAIQKNYVTEADAKAAGFRAPTNSLVGNWYVINVAETTTFSGAAAAVKTVTAQGANAASNFVYYPQMQDKVGNAAEVAKHTADPLLANGIVEAGFYDLPDLSTPFVTVPGTAQAPRDQANVLTNVLAAKTVRNQFALDTGVSAKTDWLLSMPTRRYSVAMNYNGYTRSFTPLTGNWFTSANTFVSGNQVCVNSTNLDFRDREERTVTAPTDEPVFSPSKTPEVKKASICGEAYVLAFGDSGKSVLGASVARQTTTAPFQNGWATLNLPGNGNGLPVLGSAFVKLSNPSAKAGTSGTYGISWTHSLAK